jgi:deazaflavin-dependent oxidoreductase (nitroreductase family)
MGEEPEGAGQPSPEATPTSGQASTKFVEPPRDQIPAISAAHVAVLESGNGEEFWVAAGMSHLILRTVGRRSGKEHKVALPYWTDADGRRIVVGSFAGAPQHPAWYFNLTARDVNPEVLVREKSGSYWAAADVLEGDEYVRVWTALVVDRPFYVGYTERTSRRLPLVRLHRLRPVEDAAMPGH